MNTLRRVFSAWRAFLALSLTALMLLAGNGAVGAHTELLSSDPADGANVTTSPPQVMLTFSQDVQSGFSSITVVGPDGTPFHSGALAEDGPTVTAPVQPLSTPGTYTIGYRVLSADGHPIEGSVRFIFSGSPPTQAARPAPSTTADSTTTTTSTTTASAPVASVGQDNNGAPLWPWVLGIAVLLSAGVIAAMRIGRAR